MRLSLSGITCILLTLPASADTTEWRLDPAHCAAEFAVRHMMVSTVRGSFGKVTGTAVIDDQDITHLKIEVVIDAASVNTGHTQRDEHLRGPDFFDVTKYPIISFVSKKVIKTDENSLKVLGDLTIHGMTQGITVDVEGPTPEVKDPWGSFRRGATATTKINRKDFGLTWNKALDTGGLVVGDEVNIYIEVELVRK